MPVILDAIASATKPHLCEEKTKITLSHSKIVLNNKQPSVRQQGYIRRCVTN